MILYDLQLAWRNLQNRWVQTTITLLVVALAIALFVAVAALGEAIRQGVILASDPFGVLVVGAKGSGQQLVLSTILLQGVPVGNIDLEIYEELQEDERVAMAVPLAMGDNVGGARVIGTSLDFFALTGPNNEPSPFQLSDGRLFADHLEAVLGAQSAAELGLKIGDQFVTSHGVEAGFEPDAHNLPFTVVGILQATNTPYDRAVFTDVETVWLVHEEEGAHAAEEEHADEEHADDGHTDDEHTAEDDGHGTGEDPTAVHGRITAILVKPINYGVTTELWQQFYVRTDAQAAFPGQELGGLFDQLRMGERVLNVVGYLAAGMAGLTVLLAIYSATLAREQTIAIMRSLGASRWTVLRMILFEALLVTLLGSLLGRLVGYGVAGVVANNLTVQSAVLLPISFLPELEPFLWGLPLLLALVGGLYPAVMAYRVDVVEKLFPQ